MLVFYKSAWCKQIVALFLTFVVVMLFDNSLLILSVLLLLWGLFYFPLSVGETVAFILAATFFLLQNYAVLKTGGFAFTKKEILLMPYYEPFLWGFYYLNIRRFFSEKATDIPTLGLKNFTALLATGMAFSLFSGSSQSLFLATLLSTTIVLILFHTSLDLAYGAYALGMGLAVELVGVSAGLWSYPSSDFMGIPAWFATMWISVGVLGRRFLFPLSERIAAKLSA